MSTLTIALASLGGVVLAGVVAHGAWQARKAGPKRAVPGPERAEPREPVMDLEGDTPAVADDALVAPPDRRVPAGTRTLQPPQPRDVGATDRH